MSKGQIIVLTLVVLMAPGASARPVTPPRDDLVPVYRLYNPDTGEHLYTRDTNEADVVQGEGFFYEGAPFLVSRCRGPGDAPLYRFYRPDVGHMYGTDPRPPVRGSQLEGVMGYVGTRPGRGRVLLYEFFDPGTGLHFYTTDPRGEAAPFNGYVERGVVGFVVPAR